MFQDRPLYEEMLRRGSRGRWFWRAGDALVRTGVAGIVLLLVLWPIVFYFRVADVGLIFFLLLLLMAALFTLGSFLKKISYRIALREGIDLAAFLGGGDDGKS